MFDEFQQSFDTFSKGAPSVHFLTSHEVVFKQRLKVDERGTITLGRQCAFEHVQPVQSGSYKNDLKRPKATET